jgi:hypothetical protein
MTKGNLVKHSCDFELQTNGKIKRTHKKTIKLLTIQLRNVCVG